LDVPQGRSTFTPSELDQIRGLVRERQVADRDRQKSIRARLRAMGFRISDFADYPGFVESDLDDLIARGAITVMTEESGDTATVSVRARSEPHSQPPTRAPTPVNPTRARAATMSGERRIPNARWIEASSSELEELEHALGRFDLVTVGTAFHFMEPRTTLAMLQRICGEVAVAYVGSPMDAQRRVRASSRPSGQGPPQVELLGGCRVTVMFAPCRDRHLFAHVGAVRARRSAAPTWPRFAPR
jgi:hypothetical protein